MDTPIEDSNLAYIGSDEDKAAKKAAAELEVNWEGAGQEVGIQIWRIENRRDENGNPVFGINRWPEKRYGEFYSGDSYIVLQTTEDESDPNEDDETGGFLYDVYFWIGQHSTQDEYGVAAYKANELDDLLGDSPVQHREVQSSESTEFLSLFTAIRYLDGGIDGGFRDVVTDDESLDIPTRLFRMHRSKKVTRCSQVDVKCESLNPGDTFLLDAGEVIYTWFGEGSSPFEKNKAAEVAHSMKESRFGHCTVEVDVGDDNEAFWSLLGGSIDMIGTEMSPDEVHEESLEMKMFHVSDVDSDLQIMAVDPPYTSVDEFNTGDVYILDSGHDVFIWLGKESSDREKQQAMMIVQLHIKNFGRENTTSIIRVLEGQESRSNGFLELLSG